MLQIITLKNLEIMTNSKKEFKGMDLAKAVINFKRNILNPKLKVYKGINYKSAFKFFKEINEIVGFEVFKFEAIKEELHTYKVSDRMRYNDNYKAGFTIEVSFLGNEYNSHNKEKNAAFYLANFIKECLGDTFELANRIRNY